MNLEVKLGTPVGFVLDGFNGADQAQPIPDGSTIAMTSNDPAVATVPASVPVPPGGATEIAGDVTILAVGSTDLHVTVTDPQGNPFEATATLVVDPAAQPGLVRVTLTLVDKTPPPTA